MPKIDAPTVAEHHALRQAAIVRAAVDVLATEGATAVTPAAVAAAAGMARSSVYQYYPSTGALIAAGVEELFQKALDEVVAALPEDGKPSGSAEQRVGRYLDASLDAAVRGHDPLTSLTGLTLPPECRTRIVELHDALVRPLVAALTDAGVKDAIGYAALVGSVVSGTAAQIRRGEKDKVARARMHRFVRAALA